MGKLDAKARQRDDMLKYPLCTNDHQYELDAPLETIPIALISRLPYAQNELWRKQKQGEKLKGSIAGKTETFLHSTDHLKPKIPDNFPSLNTTRSGV
jgi:hypothetical protein